MGNLCAGHRTHGGKCGGRKATSRISPGELPPLDPIAFDDPAAELLFVVVPVQRHEGGGPRR